MGIGNIQLENASRFGNLFGAEVPNTVKGDIQEISLTEIDGFKNHPFHVEDDESLEILAESIKENGKVLNPAIVRKKADGRYELISGHRRKAACEKIGLSTLPCIVMTLTDDEATIMMVDSNIQREDIKPSEKAYAYKMRYEAEKHQGTKTNSTSGTGYQKCVGAALGAEYRLSEKQFRNYVKLADLHPYFMKMVDEKSLSIKIGLCLSHITPEESELLIRVLKEDPVKIDQDIANRLKVLNKTKNFNEKSVKRVLYGMSKKSKKISLTINNNKITQYFPDSYTKSDIEGIVYSLLDEWKKKKDNGKL